MLTTKSNQDILEKDLDQKRCQAVLNQLFKTLEECNIHEEVKSEFIDLQNAILKANKEKK
jgi:hypothetical protein